MAYAHKNLSRISARFAGMMVLSAEILWGTKSRRGDPLHGILGMA